MPHSKPRTTKRDVPAARRPSGASRPVRARVDTTPTIPDLPTPGDLTTARANAPTQPALPRALVTTSAAAKPSTIPTLPDVPTVAPPDSRRKLAAREGSEGPKARRRSVPPRASGTPPRSSGERPDAAGYSIIPGRRSVDDAFPTLVAYLDGLPNGLGSYPEVMARGQTVRTLIHEMFQSSREGLPRELERLIRAVPAPRDWVPQVHLSALHAAVYDSTFANEGGLDAVRAWSLARNLRMLATPQYRPLLALQGPDMLRDGLKLRWAAFHRGTTLEVVSASTSRATLRLGYPREAWPPVSCVILGESFRAAIMIAGGTATSVKVERESSRATIYELRWR